MFTNIKTCVIFTATLLKTLIQYFGKSLEALPGVAYTGFRDNRSTLNTKTG